MIADSRPRERMLADKWENSVVLVESKRSQYFAFDPYSVSLDGDFQPSDLRAILAAYDGYLNELKQGNGA